MPGPTQQTIDTPVGARRAYRTPTLSLLGNVRTLTETGSMTGIEDSDGNSNNMCNGNINTIFNMC